MNPLLDMNPPLPPLPALLAGGALSNYSNDMMRNDGDREDYGDYENDMMREDNDENIEDIQQAIHNSLDNNNNRTVSPTDGMEDEDQGGGDESDARFHLSWT